MSDKSSPYHGQTIALATKHHKEDVISPPFREHLQAALIVPDLDTDTLGTFTGEIERPGNMLEAAIRKARMGMDAAKTPLGLSSEGSFGSHPVIPFLPCDTEIMVFIDDERGFTLHEIVLSEHTNYSHACVNTLEEARTFAEVCKTPSHAVILRPHQWDDKRIIFKGVMDEIGLQTAFTASRHASRDGKVWVETDMRAQFNPSRQKVIGELAIKLAKRLGTPCPACSAPGWGRTGVEKGLHCEYCDLPTDMVKTEVFSCVLCDHKEHLPRNDKLEWAPQVHCGYCNP